MCETGKFHEVMRLFRTRLHDEVVIVDNYRVFEGPVVYIFRANIERHPAAVKRFFGITEDHKHWKYANKPGKADWLVLMYGEEKFYLFPRYPGFIAGYAGRSIAYRLKQVAGSIRKAELREQIWGKVIIPSGTPCSHRGCASHISHPCEGCGRIGARGDVREKHFL